MNTKQILINNSFTNRATDKEITRMRTYGDSHINVIIYINLFYKQQMSNSYETDESVLTEIVVRNVSCVNDNDQLKLIY